MYIYEERLLLNSENYIDKINEWAKEGWRLVFFAPNIHTIQDYTELTANTSLGKIKEVRRCILEKFVNKNISIAHNGEISGVVNYGQVITFGHTPTSPARPYVPQTVSVDKHEPDLTLELKHNESVLDVFKNKENAIEEGKNKNAENTDIKSLEKQPSESPIDDILKSEATTNIYEVIKNYEGNIVSIICPCFERPERTKRAIDCVMQQDIDKFQALFIGDDCASFNQNNQYHYSALIPSQTLRNRDFKFLNFAPHSGGFGFKIRQVAKMFISGEYVVFLDNDDTIKPNHLSVRLSEIVGTDLDFIVFNTWDNTNGRLIEAKPEKGHINHGSFIIRSEFYKTIPEQKPERGHDWTLFLAMRDKTTKWKFSDSKLSTYNIMSTPQKPEKDID